MWYFWKFVDALAFGLATPLMLIAAPLLAISTIAKERHLALAVTNGDGK